MHMRFSYIALSCCLVLVTAFRLDLHGQRRAFGHLELGKRSQDPASELNNSGDISYYAHTKVGGRDYTLLVDTGSSDIWIAGSVPNTNDTQYNSSVNYAVGSVTGPIKTTEVGFVGYVIPDQAFLQITPDSVNNDGDGILGLGPNEGSNIYQEMGGVAGAALLDRIFLQNRTTPNYLTVLLGRSEDPTDFYGGSLTIGEVVEGFEEVLKQPKLSVVNFATHQQGNQHFQVLLDEDGLIGPDGKAIPVRSGVASNSNRGRATAVLDTGFSLPQIPSPVAAAIYGRFLGAQLVDIESVGNIWLLPCEQEVNITFKFSGKSFPIHPLDATLDPKVIGITGVIDAAGQTMCIGTFQPFSYSTGTTPSYDMVLGMAFLRNVYVLMDYGDFILGSDKKDAPYVQFLATTDPQEAHSDFVKVRLNGTDTTGEHRVTKRKDARAIMYYIIVAVIVVMILTLLGLFMICRARRRRNLGKAELHRIEPKTVTSSTLSTYAS